MTKTKTTCPRCKGKGYRMLIVGPMVLGSQASPGGKAKYDCKMCQGTGQIKGTTMPPRPNSQARRVLTALQSGPRTTAELAELCPYGHTSVIAGLRRQGYQINVEQVHGSPSTRYAIYTLTNKSEQ